jgi:type III restriction enzyme
MRFQLEQLDYQAKAIASAVLIFRGQARNSVQALNLREIYPNQCDLSAEQVAANVRSIADQNGIPEDQSKLCADVDYSIEMETGTGKTLVYLRTIYELYRTHGLSKFIILVPSVAIREGVSASFATFKDQLTNLYGFAPAFFEYDSKKLHLLKHFIADTRPQIMVMTSQSFTADDRIINQSGRDDSFEGLSYLAALGQVRPIIIMDEPQEGMDTEKAIERIRELRPLATFRYSATHKVLRNLIYRLTPFDAYKQGLVKKIEVLNVAERNDEATLKIELAEVKTGKGDPVVKLRAWVRRANGSFEFAATRWMKLHENLGEVTGNVSYREYIIDQIVGGKLAGGRWKVRFANGTEVIEGERAADLAGLFRQQLHWTIRRHFDRRAELRPMGIKPLVLVFIDRVANYVAEDGLIRRLFREEYAAIFNEKNGRAPTADEIEAVQGSYFAQTNAGEYTDSASSMQKNKEMFDLILRDRETLLTMENPVEFIFSHSALGVGWDNPNIFTIATLNQSFSEVKKRQEIGRGLRICRNQAGVRVHDTTGTEEGKEINLLTVIPNESYETFVIQYQQEIRDQYGSTDSGSHLRHRPKGTPRAKKVRRQKHIFESAEFREFWTRLGRKTNYTVAFREDEVVARAIEALNAITIPEYRAEAVLHRIDSISTEGIAGTEQGRAETALAASYTPLDVVEELSELTSLSYRSVLNIVQGLSCHDHITRNPPRWIQVAAQKIKLYEREEMLRALDYTPNGETIALDILQEVFPTFQTVEPTPHHGVYDHAVCDSSSVEQPFARAADRSDEVMCFLKLPEKYIVPTPIGDYRPDWGIVMRRRDLRTGTAGDFYFVVETKGTNDLDDPKALTDEERYKIKCAKKHYAALGVELQYHAPRKDWQSFLNGVRI